MEHVSTLCAVSTVGIAATGFSLARREQQNWSQSFSSSRNSTTSRILPTDTVNSKRFPNPSRIEGSAQERTDNKPGSADIKPNLVLSQRRRERRRRQTYANPPSKLAGEASAQESSVNSGRPSSSWLRRISIISSTTGSSVPSPTTTSSSANGPSAQALSRSNSIIKAPNKLIKRSTSQHSIRQPEGGSGRSRSNTLGLRRPATSHQRSGKIDHRISSSQDVNLSAPPGFLESLLAKGSNLSDFGNNKWRPFFVSAYDKRRKGSTSNAIVTIKPSRPSNSPYYFNYPTLMLSSSIKISKAAKMATKESSSQPPDAIPFNDPFSRHADANNVNHAHSNPKDKRRSIRSSSISDLSGSNRKSRGGSVKGESKSPMAASRFYSKDRNVSNPLPRTSGSIGTGKSGSPRLRRKRNFTESDTFHRPQTAPNVAHFYSQSSYADAPFPQGLALQVDSLKSTDSSISYRTESYDKQPSPTSFPSAGTSPPIVRYSRNKRLSGATSDWASTLIGSDDTRVFTSADEDDQSDSVFDSFRTRMSSSSHPGRRGPNIETIFDDAPQGDLKKCGPTTVNELGFENLRLSQFTPRSSISDVNSMSTPLALSDTKDADATPTPPTRNLLKTSPHPSPPKTSDSRMPELAIRTDYDTILVGGDDEFDTSFEEHFADIHSQHDHDAFTPSLTRKSSGIGTRASVFDWSEQTWSERDPQAHEVRPSTVHGKQGIGPRNTRRVTRKVPSAIHLRSQSVPVSRDGPTPSDSRQPSAKFGTWGLGQKGVSEDWDGDFDFGDSDADGNIEIGENTTSGGRLHIMKVPQAIMETQASVHGQYGQVQELTLLVEELKRLRTQGNTLHLIHGVSSELWKEAEGIVNLATFEDDDNTWQAPVSPSSVGSFDDFDTSPSPPQKAWKHNDNDTKRPPLTLWSEMDHSPKLSDTKDPSTKAKSVLETIYQQRESSDTQSFENPSQPQQKLPFDTQSLKELVTRAGVVTRALKDVIRRAEGVATSPESTIPSNPPFSRIFVQES